MMLGEPIQITIPNKILKIMKQNIDVPNIQWRISVPSDNFISDMWNLKFQNTEGGLKLEISLGKDEG